MLNETHIPTRKVGAGLLAGAITGLVIFAIHNFTAVKIDADTAVYLSTVITFITQYLVPEAE
jgi:hypothetical protein